MELIWCFFFCVAVSFWLQTSFPNEAAKCNTISVCAVRPPQSHIHLPLPPPIYSWRGECLWPLALSREVSRWIPRSSVFSGSLLGVYPGHLTDSRISLLEFLVFALALNGFANKDLWWAVGGRVSPQPLLQQVSSEYMGLEGWLPCLGYQPAVYLASLIYSFLADRETIIKVPTS